MSRDDAPIEHPERAGLDDPVQIAIEHLQLLAPDGERHLARLARREVHAAKTRELHHRSRDRREHVADIQLHDLVAGTRAGVRDPAANRRRTARRDLGRLDRQNEYSNVV